MLVDIILKCMVNIFNTIKELLIVVFFIFITKNFIYLFQFLKFIYYYLFLKLLLLLLLFFL